MSAAVRLLQLEKGRVTLGGGGRWILLEPAPGPLYSLLAAVEQFSERGFRPLIAHPERHLASDLEQRLTAAIERGALVQATAAQLVAGDTAPAMLALARRGLIHVLGSDAHSAQQGRPVRLSEGMAELRAVDGIEPHMDWVMRVAPNAIVRGEHIQPPFAPVP